MTQKLALFREGNKWAVRKSSSVDLQTSSCHLLADFKLYCQKFISGSRLMLLQTMGNISMSSLYWIAPPSH